MASLRFPRLLGLLLLLAACAKSGPETTDPNGPEIDPYQNLTFAFDRAVVDQAQQDRWDTARVVAFEPAVRGKYKWISDRELVFSPLTPFRPSTTFRATLRMPALPADARGVALPADRTVFHTPYLRPGTVRAFWGRSRRATGTAELRLDLPFNYAVRPADLRPLLRLTQDGQPVAFEVLSTAPDQTMQLGLTQDARPGAPLTVALAAGLRAAGSDQPTTQDFTQPIDVPDPQALAVSGISGSLQGPDPVVLVHTNQPVTEADLPGRVAVSPQVAFTVEAREGGFTLRGGFEVGKATRCAWAAACAARWAAPSTAT